MTEAAADAGEGRAGMGALAVVVVVVLETTPSPDPAADDWALTLTLPFTLPLDGLLPDDGAEERLDMREVWIVFLPFPWPDTETESPTLLPFPAATMASAAATVSASLFGGVTGLDDAEGLLRSPGTNPSAIAALRAACIKSEGIAESVMIIMWCAAMWRRCYIQVR